MFMPMQDPNSRESISMAQCQRYVYMQWFSQISRPLPNSQLHVVKKELSHNMGITSISDGVVLLLTIIAPFPLAPVLPAQILKVHTDSMTSMETEKEFYINPFISHLD